MNDWDEVKIITWNCGVEEEGGLELLNCSYCGRPIDAGSDYDTPHDEDCPNADAEPDEDGLQLHVDCICDNYMCIDCAAEETRGMHGLGRYV